MTADDLDRAAGYRAVAALYHAYLTGLILTVVSRRGGADAAELVFRTFRRQHLEKFLPGLVKLGLDRLPHAVACAQYHYLSNYLGGVRVEYMYESDRKAWVRYVPPRWIYDGTAICGVPSEVSRAILRGWHAHNGVTLGNPRLGFVCTKQTTDGQPGLEGYYYEHDRDLEPDERLRFAPGEEGPDFDPAAAPRVEGADWPAARLEKIVRNYAMEYVRTILPVLAETFGPDDARYLGGHRGAAHRHAVRDGARARTRRVGALGRRRRRDPAPGGRGAGRPCGVELRGRRGGRAPAHVAVDGGPSPSAGVGVRRVERALGGRRGRARPAPPDDGDAADRLGRRVDRVAHP